MHRNKKNAFGFDFDEIGKAIDDFFTTSGINDIFGRDAENKTPLVNVLEYEDRMEIELAAPGLYKEDFKLNVEENVLTISTDRNVKKEDENVKIKRKEFNYSTFKKSFRLTDKFDPQRITAKYVNGILYVSVPNKEQKDKETIRIEVL